MNDAIEQTAGAVAPEAGRWLPVSQEVEIAILVFLAVLLGVLALVGLVHHLRGWAAPEIERRLRALESGGRDRRELGSILRAADLAELEGLGLGSRWLHELSLLQRLQRLLGQAGLTMSPGEYLGCVALAAAAGAVVGYALGWRDPRLALLALAGALVPLVWLWQRRGRRFLMFSEQLPDALGLMAGSLRAGHAYSASVRVVGEELSDPVASEFHTMAEEYRVGLSHRECLERLLSRVDHPDLHLFAISVLIQSETGGNLAEVLESLAHTIRSRFQLLGQVRAITAEGRLSGIVLAALPIIVGGILAIINPEYMRPLLFTNPGRMAIGIAVVMQLLGFLWIRRIVRVRA